MNFGTALLIVSLFTTSAIAVGADSPAPAEDDSSSSSTTTATATCATGRLSFSGDTMPILQVQAWAEAYRKKCPHLEFDWDYGGFSMATSRVCDHHPVYGAVDAAALPINMFFPPQATTSDDWNFQCVGSDRSAIMLHVGHSGMRLDVAAGGSAAACIKLMGGLSIDQIRWIYSSLSEKELRGFKWDASAVPFSDGDATTHKWNELHENCTADDIFLVGPADKSSIGYTYLLDHVLTGQSEVPRAFQEYESMEEMDALLQSHPNAVAFWPFYNMLDPNYAGRAVTTHSVAIRNSEGKFIMPSTESFEEHTYPLLRRVDLTIHNDPTTMAKMLPFLEFALTPEGDEAIKQQGFWPIRMWEKRAMLARLGSSRFSSSASDIAKWCSSTVGEVLIGGNQVVKPIAHLWTLLYKLACEVDISMEVEESGEAASRICMNDIDIAMMIRDWKEEEGVQLEHEFAHIHKCPTKVADISTIQLTIATEGIVILVTQNSAAGDCIQTMGGLTRDQLRWIYSSYTDDELISSGWETTSLRNSDGNSATHLWSELDPRCEQEEIMLAGDPPGDDLFEIFSAAVLPMFDQGERLALNRSSGYFAEHSLEVLVHLVKNTGAMAFVPFHYYFENQDLFSAVPIQGDAGNMVAPTEETITGGTYPLLMDLGMSILNNAESVAHTVPFLEFGLNNPEFLAGTGYFPVDGDALQETLRALENAPYPIAATAVAEDDSGFDMEVGLIVGIAVAALLFVCLGSLSLWYFCMKREF